MDGLSNISTSQTIRGLVKKLPIGKPFGSNRFLQAGSRAAVDKTLSRLVSEGMIQRAFRGVFFRPKKSRFIGSAMPGVQEIVKVIAKNHGETIQIHGAEAARRFQLTTQVPMTPVFNTSGLSRTLKLGNLNVRLKHVSPRKLYLAGTRPGLGLSALWYLGKDMVTKDTIAQIHSHLSEEEFTLLKKVDKPTWMAAAFRSYEEGTHE